MNKTADLRAINSLKLEKLASPGALEASYGSDSFEEAENSRKEDDQDVDLDESGDEEEGNFTEGMNLDDFLKQFSENNGTNGDGNAENQAEQVEDPSMRPLEGLSPPVTGADERDEYLSKKLNHQNIVSPEAFANISKLSPEMKQKAVLEAEEANAARVDELLKRLNINHTVDNIIESSKLVPVEYPVFKDSNSQYANSYKNSKQNEIKVKHVPLPLMHKYNAGMQDDARDDNQGRGDPSSRDIVLLQVQIKELKADMKRRDDRLGRLSEHDSLLQSKCDSLTREVSYLKQCLSEANSEIKAQMVRADNAILNKKKKKKVSKAAENIEAEAKVLAESNERLLSRESALMEAIDELSKQNEELMKQLKDSMDKEARYTQVIHTLTMQHGEYNTSKPQQTKQAEQIMKSGAVGVDSDKKNRRRDRSLSTSGVPDGNSYASNDNNSKASGKLPSIPYHRHNFARAFHCYD